MSTTINLYSASELKEAHPDGFENALQDWQDNQDEIFWADETIESMLAVIKASGLHLQDYSLGTEAYRSYVKIDWNYHNSPAENLEGQRAMAWLENNLLDGLREHKRFINRVKRYANDSKPHVYTRYNKIPSCPFTGYCADEDYLESLIKDINDGCTLGEAYNNLAGVCSHLLEQEQENQMSEEYFVDHADANDYQFTEDGQQVY